MLNRRVTRTLLNSAEKTTETGSLNSETLTVNLKAADALYVGYHGPFAARYIQVSNANSVSARLSAYYWNGTAWTLVEDLQDATLVSGATLAQSGFISWENADDWAKSELPGVDAELYWIKLTVNATLTTSTAIQSITNLFSDDTLLRAYYPELVSDASYLPSGRNNFIEQHEAAKNLCVQRLKQRHLIDDESQIIDINSVSVAAVHATAWLILNPISTGDAHKDLAGRAFDQFNAEIGSLDLDIDQNKDGIVNDEERAPTMNSLEVTRR